MLSTNVDVERQNIRCGQQDGLSYSDSFSFTIPGRSVMKKTIKKIKSGDRFLLYSGQTSHSFPHRGVFFAVYEASSDVKVMSKEFVLDLSLIASIEPKLSMKQLSELSECEGIALFNRCNGQRVITQIEHIPV